MCYNIITVKERGKIKMNKKRYLVTIKYKDDMLFRKEFVVLRSAEKWSCKMVHKLLVCDAVATITSNETGEIMTLISR